MTKILEMWDAHKVYNIRDEAIASINSIYIDIILDKKYNNWYTQIGKYIVRIINKDIFDKNIDKNNDYIFTFKSCIDNNISTRPDLEHSYWMYDEYNDINLMKKLKLNTLYNLGRSDS